MTNGVYVHRHAYRLFHARDRVQLHEAGRVDDVGARVAVGDQAGDRVVEVASVTQVVLRAGGEHERPAGGLGGGRDTLGGDADVLDPAGDRVVVLDRAAGGAGLLEEPNRLGDAARLVRV